MTRVVEPSNAELLEHASELVKPPRPSSVVTTQVRPPPLWRPKSQSIVPTEFYEDTGYHQGEFGKLQSAVDVHLRVTTRIDQRQFWSFWWLLVVSFMLVMDLLLTSVLFFAWIWS